LYRYINELQAANDRLKMRVSALADWAEAWSQREWERKREEVREVWGLSDLEEGCRGWGGGSGWDNVTVSTDATNVDTGSVVEL